MASFIEFPIEVDEDELAQRAMDAMKVIFPSWTPNEAHLEVAILEEMARMAAETAEVAAAVAASIFRTFGSDLVGIPSQQGASAATLTDWTAVDTEGYTIPLGTVVGIRLAADQVALFTTTQTAEIPAGSNTVAAVPVAATETGIVYNGLVAGPMELVDSLGFVSTVVSTVVTSGGVEQESDEEYLDRLHDALQLLTPRPILPRDFAILARNVTGVYRARALDGYNMIDGTYGNPRMLTVAPLTVDGAPVSAGVKTVLQDFFNEQREVNFIVHVLDPAFQAVTIIYQAISARGADPTEVHDAASAAVAAYIHPKTYAGGEEQPPVWNDTNVVRYLEVASILNNVPDLGYLIDLTINNARSDVVLSGAATLPKAVGPNPATDSVVQGSVTAP